jgi:chromate transporter
VQKPSYSKLFLAFLKLGAGAFGGPALVEYIRKLSVEQNSWIDSDGFNDGVALCQSIPGATAMQMATYVGLKTKGISGAILSCSGFVLPAFLLMLVFSVLYKQFHDLPRIISIFAGLNIIIVAIMLNATYSFGKTSLKDHKDAGLALISAGLLWIGVSPFLVVLGAALLGTVVFKGKDLVVGSAGRGTALFHMKHILFFSVILVSGFVLLYLFSNKLLQLSVVMFKVNLFAFGGGYGALPLMLHEVVNIRGWMNNKTFMDAIALGQVTPGPTIITSTFVGYLVDGMSGAIVSTLSSFASSFFVLIVAVPFFEKLRISRYFYSATRGVFVTFVGLLLYVSVNFSLAIPWDIIKIIFALLTLFALFKKIDILHVVLAGIPISILLFR